jgi:hypothetical protein
VFVNVATKLLSILLGLFVIVSRDINKVICLARIDRIVMLLELMLQELRQGPELMPLELRQGLELMPLELR